MTVKILNIINAFPKRKIGVIGDIMLDHYITGLVERVSPEAPVPVIRTTIEKFVPGGAANTALNIVSLDASAELVGVVGRDMPAKKVLDILNKNGVFCRGIFVDRLRRTTEKIRITASGQHVVRIDREDVFPIKKAIERRIIDFISSRIAVWDAVVVSDYAKGTLTPFLAAKIIELARRYKKPIIADTKPANFDMFKGVTLISPNKKEAAEASGLGLNSEKEIRSAGEYLRKKMRAHVLLTRGSEGMTLFEGSRPVSFPSFAPAVVDGAGAGDTVVAVSALAIASGAAYKQAALISSYAAGVVVGKPGTASVSLKELIAHVERQNKIIHRA